MNEIRIQAITWNVAQLVNIKESRFDVIADGHDAADIISISLQETQTGVSSFLLENPSLSDQWLSSFEQMLNNSFLLVAVEAIAGLLMAIYARPRVYAHIADVAIASLPLGPFGLYNKGCVAVRFRVADMTYCFVNAHLEAHGERYSSRVEQYFHIQDLLRFGDVPETTMLDHNFIVFNGDLNFRLNCSYKHATSHLASVINDNRQLQAMIETSLLPHDQLAQAIKEEKVLAEFTESAITFPPTYKFDLGTNIYDSSDKKRVPSWTDRIFIKGRNASIIEYDSVSLSLSDHHPVICKIQVELTRSLQAKAEEPIKTVRREIGVLTPLGREVSLFVVAILSVVGSYMYYGRS
eukprot:CFRG1320T1